MGLEKGEGETARETYPTTFDTIPAHFSMTPWGKHEKFVSKAVPLLPAMQGLEVTSFPDRYART